ncbi:MAG: fluoride efflux transporter CrcB [Alphaproteobacteria bacterium]|nr:MAG: fluoride efflux transporter CrcB [Alphaproteobacteria bacterium]
MMSFVLWVALGSALGGGCRFLVSGLVARRFGETFPWGTMAVNVTGAYGIGFLSVMAQSGGIFDRPEAKLLVVTGFLGSYTTVSSFSLQTLALAQDGQFGRAAANVILSLGLCLGAVAAGIASMPLVMQ